MIDTPSRRQRVQSVRSTRLWEGRVKNPWWKIWSGSAPADAGDDEYREFLSADSGAPVDEVFGERLRRQLRSLVGRRYWKQGIATGFELMGLNRAGVLVQNRLLWPWARALNYHDVPVRLAGAFEEQLRFFAEHFVSVGPAELAELHAGSWTHEKPGLLLTFDDGLRSHADVVAPLLEKYRFSGWFNVPVGFIDAAPAEQEAFARRHQIHCDASGLPDQRIALSWDDLRRLDGAHEICCHGFTHRRLGPCLTPEELALEIDGAKQRLEAELGHAVRAFTWIGGEEWAYTREAAERIRAAGFELAFMTNNAVIRPDAELLQVQRTNIEADFDPDFLRLCLSGFYDLLYGPKRRRVNELTAARAA
jgi:peptidoglycan/xylan/chitin deacetylase (PgdA/CDA1 family)